MPLRVLQLVRNGGRRARAQLVAAEKKERAMKNAPGVAPTNVDRAAWAGVAAAKFQAITGSDDEDVVCDLVCDLMHLAIALGQDPFAQVRRGIGHYIAETYSPEDEPARIDVRIISCPPANGASQ
jgi:hypothetical protein